MTYVKPIKAESIKSIGFMQIQNMNFVPNAHRQVELALIVSGKVKVKIEDEEFLATAGDIIFISEYMIHAYETIDESVIIGSTFRKECSREINEYIETYFPHPFHYHNDETKANILNLAKWIEQTKDYSTNLQRLTYLLFAFEYIDKDKINFIGDKPDNLVLSRVLQYADENLTRKLTLETVAYDLGISKYYLSHLCQDKMGMGFMAYFTSLKLSAAKRLLVERDATIDEIAKEVNFGSSRTFNRLFKEHFNISPSEFRTQGRKSDYLEISSKQNLSK